MALPDILCLALIAGFIVVAVLAMRLGLMAAFVALLVGLFVLLAGCAVFPAYGGEGDDGTFLFFFLLGTPLIVILLTPVALVGRCARVLSRLRHRSHPRGRRALAFRRFLLRCMPSLRIRLILLWLVELLLVASGFDWPFVHRATFWHHPKGIPFPWLDLIWRDNVVTFVGLHPVYLILELIILIPIAIVLARRTARLNIPLLRFVTARINPMRPPHPRTAPQMRLLFARQDALEHARRQHDER